MWLKLHEQGTHAVGSLKNISLLMGLEAKKVQCVLKRVIIDLLQGTSKHYKVVNEICSLGCSDSLKYPPFPN